MCKNYKGRVSVCKASRIYVVVREDIKNGDIFVEGKNDNFVLQLAVSRGEEIGQITMDTESNRGLAEKELCVFFNFIEV